MRLGGGGLSCLSLQFLTFGKFSGQVSHFVQHWTPKTKKTRDTALPVARFWNDAAFVKTQSLDFDLSGNFLPVQAVSLSSINLGLKYVSGKNPWWWNETLKFKSLKSWKSMGIEIKSLTMVIPFPSCPKQQKHILLLFARMDPPHLFFSWTRVFFFLFECVLLSKRMHNQGKLPTLVITIPRNSTNFIPVAESRLLHLHRYWSYHCIFKETRKTLHLEGEKLPTGGFLDEKKPKLLFQNKWNRTGKWEFSEKSIPIYSDFYLLLSVAQIQQNDLCEATDKSNVKAR